MNLMDGKGRRLGTNQRGDSENPNFTLRPATEGDFSFIHALRAAGLRAYIDPVWGWDDAAQFDRFRARFDPAVFVVIVFDGRDVGVMAVEWKSGEALLTDLYICQEWQNRGLGAAVLGSIISEATRRGVPVTLKVLKNNPARRLYERLGFQLVNETESHYWMQTVS